MTNIMRLGAIIGVLGVLAAAVNAGHARTTDNAVVTMLEGSAKVTSKKSPVGTALKKDDHVHKGQEIRVGDRSRLELRFPDGTVMRFSERSTVKMDDLAYDSKTQSKKVRVDMERGKLWASVRKMVTADSRVEVKTVNAVAGVRGTVYRVNVEDDDSALVKVYDGSVYVDGVQKSGAKEPPAGGFTAPVPVPGPSEVAPPYHEVSMEEWHVIVKSFQQVTISPTGAASTPQDFNRLSQALERDGVRLVYLFGSALEQPLVRDIDLAVLFEEYRFDKYLATLETACQVLGTRQVDLVVLNRANPRLKLEVLLEGKPLFIKAPGAQAEAVGQALKAASAGELSPEQASAR